MTESGGHEPSQGLEPEPTRPRLARRFQVILFGGTLVVSLGLVRSLHKSWGRDILRLEQELAAEKKREAELGFVKKSFEDREHFIREFQTSVQTIDSLQKSRRSPVEWMLALSNVLARTADVNLSSVTEQSSVLVLKGEARSAEAQAKFRASLERTGRFSSVKFVRLGEEMAPGGTAYRFILYCVLPATPRPEAAEETRAPRSRSAPRGQSGKGGKN